MKAVLIAGALAVLMACATTAPAPASLRAERDRAVRAGLRWLDAYLADEAHAEWLGIDAVAIFADFAASAADEAAAACAAAAARRQARDLAAYFLAAEDLPNGEALDLLLLLSLADELDLDPAPLRAKAAAAIARLPSPDAVYDLPGDVADLDEVDLLDLLLSVYAVERAAAAGYDFGVRYGLADLLPEIRRRPLPTGGEEFRDVVYRETHVAYVLSDYGRLRLREADAPSTFGYLRSVLPSVLAAGDLELVAEITDVLRSLCEDETTDPAIRAGTLLILSTQHPDGHWGPGRAEPDPYFAVHPTWCAVMALQARKLRHR